MVRTTGVSSGVLVSLVAAWDRLRASPLRKGAFLFVAAALLVFVAASVPDRESALLAAAERFAFDHEMRLLRQVHPRPLADDVVLVGTDEQTYRAFKEPFALWHRHFAGVMHALAKARPRAVGMDFVLPEDSFEFILPGGDIAMMRGLLDLKRAAPLVYVQTVDSQGKIVPVQPNYRAVVGDENLGVDQHLRDADGVSRRFGPMLDAAGQPIPSLVSQLLVHLGRKPDAGFIDYSLGADFRYIPIQQLAGWDEQKLRATFGGRVVLVGSLVGFVDRWRLPTRLLEIDPGRRADASASDSSAFVQPGVLVHAQALRSHLGPGLLHPFSPATVFGMVGLALFAVLMRSAPGTILLAAVLVPLALVAAGLVAMASLQRVVPVATLVFAFWIALLARGFFDAVEAMVERVRLHRTFAGQVSPAVMQEMLGGTLSPGINGQLADVCVLFSDVRDFTTLSERMSPEVVTTVLQRYFDRMVKAVHRYEGTVDKFIGDGMMVLFGAPQKLEDSCGKAVECALAMMSALDALNEEFRVEGLPQLTIGIGINFGRVTVGNIGSSERHNYSAIGDAVNVAARLEGLTKGLGRKILITEAVVERLGGRFQFESLGSHNVKGHSPVRVWGIRTRPATQSVAQAARMATT
jgi:adenylate cyclase